jgi:hypothetical protein
MDDIPERMRKYVTHGGKVYESDAKEAADEIERLRGLLREAVDELDWWIHEHGCCDGHQGDLLDRIAAALQGRQG